MGNHSCNPSPGTVDKIFTVARNTGVVPDVTMDHVLIDLLSLNSSDVLSQQYADLQVSLPESQLSDFNRSLTTMFGEGGTVAFGSVGVVALALSLLFEALSLQVVRRPTTRPPDPIRRIFGADHSSDVGPIASEYLKQVPRVAGNPVRMLALTERCESELTRELTDRYEAMTEEHYVIANGVKQWVNGAALHLHMRIHLVRLGATQKDSARSLAVSYQTKLPVVMRSYSEHIRRSIREKPPAAGTARQGLLILERLRNVTHEVQHRPCESDAIAGALADRILALQDLQQSLDFFKKTEMHMDLLIAQQGNFSLPPREWLPALGAEDYASGSGQTPSQLGITSPSLRSGEGPQLKQPHSTVTRHLLLPHAAC
ncbi:uncharacterized protein LOC108918864 [Arapaima gigas]